MGHYGHILKVKLKWFSDGLYMRGERKFRNKFEVFILGNRSFTDNVGEASEMEIQELNF